MRNIRDEDLLALETRAKIHEVVKGNPGIPLRKLAEKSGVPLASLVYHLKILKDGRLVVSQRNGKHVCHFLVGSFSPAERIIISSLWHKTRLQIVRILLKRDGLITRESLSKILGIHKGTLTFHLQELTVNGTLRREPRSKTYLYTLADPQLIQGILSTIQSPDWHG